MIRKLLLCSCCISVSAGNAFADPIEAFWQEIPINDNPADTSDLTGFRSFDLFVQLEPGDVVESYDLGISETFPPLNINTGLQLGAGQDFFQHQFGNDTAVDPIFEGAIPDIGFDTRFQLGNKEFDLYDSVATIWDPAGVEAVVYALSQDTPEKTYAYPDENGVFWIGRFTVNSLGTFGEDTSTLGEFMGGGMKLSGSPGFESGTNRGYLEIPNAFAIPAPSNAALFIAVPGLVAARRRRL